VASDFRAAIVAYAEGNCARFDVANPVPLPPPGFDDVSVDKQIEYVQSLWDRIAAIPEQVPIPEWHRDILDERPNEYEANPNAGESWDVVRERLRDKLRQR
jgi:putative addiction module component (TIGR02574 family)